MYGACAVLFITAGKLSKRSGSKSAPPFSVSSNFLPNPSIQLKENRTSVKNARRHIITNIPDRMHGKFFSISQGYKALKEGLAAIPKELLGFK
jgi:hypothetical protein